MTDFAEVIQSLNVDDPRANIAAIKGAVKDRFHETDTRVSVAVTDHFNHSFVPDLVLSWPDSKDTRHVFLRTAYREDELRRDIDLLGKDRPILMSLDKLPVDKQASDELRSSAKETNSLVADPYGLEALDEEAATKPVVSLLSHAVLQGGRGVMSSEAARTSGSLVDAGFDAARAGEPTATSAAVDGAADLLDSFRASQINRLLHAVWLGSGRPASSFPGAAGVTAVLDAESLRFVLQLPDIDDDDFWRRLGSGLTTDRLCELREFPASDNFQRLLAGNAYKLTAKACRTIRVANKIAEPTWSVAAKTLVLSVESDRIHFAPRAVDELPQPSDDTSAPTVNDLQGRARAAQLRLGEVRLSDGEHIISYGAEDDADIAEADALAALQALIPNAALASATVHMGSKEVRCTFRTRTIAGNSSARFGLGELARVAVPLIVAPPTEQVAAVNALFERPAAPQELVEAVAGIAAIESSDDSHHEADQDG